MAPQDEGIEEERWCADQRDRVIAYLDGQRLVRGEVGEWPAWHVYPHIAVWAIESATRPGWVGWWAISGDCPTDYTTCRADRTPRGAVRDIATRWQEALASWAKGEPAGGWSIGTPEEQTKLAPQLAARVETLLGWAADDSLWDE